MKKIYSFIIFILILLLLSCCGKTDDLSVGLWPEFFGIDFKQSQYKHINNGGVTISDVMPYNIDAITGATVTVQGPGLTNSIPLSMREIENANDGIYRSVYLDESGAFIYEGLDLYYLLHDMTRGDKGIILTETAFQLQLKDHNRKVIADITLEEIEQAHMRGRPYLLAYGIATLDEQIIAPFVFDGATPDIKSEGYIIELDNGGGCLRLVFDPDGSGSYDGLFENIAYIYIGELTEPGFKHTTGTMEDYGSSRYCDYIVTFRGDALGAEINLTVAQLEDLVQYTDDGNVSEDSIGYRNSYSLANNAYWYVNEYEGVDLYKLLLMLGMEDADSMGLAKARTTLVSFVADDGFYSKESFSVDTLSYPDIFGFYNKNSVDTDDGSYIPTGADLEQSGYPVLLAYGLNRYPYTITKTDEGYMSGLSNSGGPLRVVFGKTQYNHPNGSNQVQFIRDIIVGNDCLYNTHQHSDNAALQQLGAAELTLTVNGTDGKQLSEKVITVAEIEDLIYGEEVAKDQKKAALAKNHYQQIQTSGYVTDIYEGVSLEYLLLNILALPGKNGTVTFTSENGSNLTVNLDCLFNSGYNTELSRDGLIPIIAFSKNGAPMTSNEHSPGYIKQIDFISNAPSGSDYLSVDNCGGPLAVFIPSSKLSECDAVSIMQVVSIEIDLLPDSYAHIESPYDTYTDSTVRFYGEGLEKEREYSLGELEGKQISAKTLDLSIIDDAGNYYEVRYRGLNIYDLFVEVGLNSNASDVIFYNADGNTLSIPLGDLRKRNNENVISPEKEPTFAMLAYGVGIVGEDIKLGLPLVTSDSDTGYALSFGNDGGPLKLLLPNTALSMTDIVAVEVTANDIDSWGHAMSDIYSEF
ncbi:MAG: hypothetical protein FWG21_06555, partial [Oscillospiraceae bacterium]|nr:hypothetical protein [Oscillospiraceae bacterium]